MNLQEPRVDGDGFNWVKTIVFKVLVTFIWCFDPPSKLVVSLSERKLMCEDAQDAFAGSGPESCSMAPPETILLILPVPWRCLDRSSPDSSFGYGAKTGYLKRSKTLHWKKDTCTEHCGC